MVIVERSAWIGSATDRDRRECRETRLPGDPTLILGESELEQRYRQLVPRRDDGVALDGEDARLTYDALGRTVEACVEALRAHGVRAGTAVVVACPSGLEHVVAVLALAAAGAVAVPVAADAPEGRRAAVARSTGAALWIDLPGRRAPDGVRAATMRIAPRGDDDDLLALRAPGAGGAPAPPRAPPRSERDDIALVRFSSGSSGEPKGVMIRFDQMVAMASLLASRFALGASHRELIVAPMAYSGAWQRVAATLRAGGCVVVPSGPAPVQKTLEDLRAREITGFFTPPPLLRVMLSLPEDRVRAALAPCRSIEIGSGPVTADELVRMMALAPGARLFHHYGLTECSRAFILDARSSPTKLHTVGRPAAGVEASIRGGAGDPIGVGRVGEVFLRGPQRAAGYWDNPELERAAFVDDWLATGDHGMLDEDGFLVIRGRADDRICCGGHSFYPAEAEDALGRVAGVERFMLAGAPDDLLGEVVWAFVVPGESAWSAADFLRQARRRLPAHMAPRRVVVVDELPVTGSGKLDRRGAVAHHTGHQHARDTRERP